MPRDPAGWELRYLSWGLRWMGEHPIPLAMHEGWVYAVICEGSPTVLIQDHPRRTQVGDVFIFHPDCAYGWRDQPKRSCRLMTWLWRTPPTHSLLIPAASGYRHLRVDARTLQRLTAIHQHCLQEVAVVGELAFLGLRRARLDLDICLAGALKYRDPADQRYRIDLALHFLRQNPAALQPAKRLCEYLQIAPATLRNLFQQHCGRSPQAVALEMRMRHARARLAAGHVAVKELAFELGYRHPNDFSRAYKRYFGAVATRVLRGAKKRK